MTATLRDRQKALTRDAIVDATARLVVQRGIHGFSIDDVAELAGVSSRTLYRHFESRPALLQAIGDAMAAHIAQASSDEPIDDLGQAPGLVRRRFAIFAEAEWLARANACLAAASEQVDDDDAAPAAGLAADRRVRNEEIRAMLRHEFPDLPESVLAQLFAVTRAMASVVGFHTLTSRSTGLDANEAGVAVQWALKTLIDRARALNEAGVSSLEEDL